MSKIKAIFANKWVGFTLASLLYILWFVVWSESWWLILGVAVIYDIYISKYMSRYIGVYNAKLCERSVIYRWLYEWINALVFATVVATIIHTYVFQLYVIPTSSMEKSLLVGDYLYVSKLSYGPKLPNTPLSFPFVHHTMPFSATAKSYSDAIKLPYHRIKGLKQIERGDVVVFNFPAGDTVLLENQSVTYYDVLREYQSSLGEEAVRARLFKDYTVIARPVDKRENYIKRCVALPGDTIRVVESRLYVNGQAEAEIPGKQYINIVQTSSPISQYTFDKLDITEGSGNGAIYQIPLTSSSAESIGALRNVYNMRQYIAEGVNPDVYPSSPSLYPWNHDNMGSIWVPKRGATVELTTKNLPLYERIIDQYEGNDLRVEGSDIYINGELSYSYTFKMDYYWMMGDNRHNSADSRFWGFVPEDHIVGKASFVWLSLDANKSFPANIRWNRIFRWIK
ncbi:MAG: signal peptidase I [Rikenellaceae bacterium]